MKLQRPLLNIPKDALVELLQEVRQPWFEDPSNEDEDFTRARLRKMRASFSDIGLTPERLVATAARMSDANLVLQDAADNLWQAVATASAFGEVVLMVPDLLAARPDTRRRVLARALTGVGGAIFAPRFDRLLRLEEAIKSGEIGNGVTLHGCKICDTGQTLSVIREAGRGPFASVSSGQSGLWDGRFYVEWLTAVKGVEVRDLGEAGLAAMKESNWIPPLDAPRRDLMATLPAAWRGKELLSAPLLGYESGLFKARFMLIK